MKRQSILLLAIVVLSAASNTVFGGILIGWGNNYYGQCNVPEGNDFVAISAGSGHAMALRSDGTVAAWGSNSYGQCEAPNDSNFVAIAAGCWHSLALRADGSVEAWGRNQYGQCDVPNDADYIAIAGGTFNSLAIKSDGSIAYWGLAAGEPNTIPPAGKDFVAVDAAAYYWLARRADGSLVGWGGFYFPYECNVPDGSFVDIALGYYYDYTDFALSEDGTIIGWKSCSEDSPLDVPDGNGFQDIGYYVAIDSNGALTAWRDCLIETPAVPPNPNEPNGIPAQRIIPDGNGFITVEAGGCFGIALASSETFTLTVAVEPNFIDSVTPASGQYTYYLGEWVYINAPAHPNCPYVFEFTEWQGDVPDPHSAMQLITMTSNKTITAIYDAAERTCGDLCHPIVQGDMNEDCYVNFEDFVIYAKNWLSCTHPDCD